MRVSVCRNWRGRSCVAVGWLALVAIIASGCGSDGALDLQDWQRDVLTGVLGLAPGVVPIPIPGPAGAAGAAGAPGPNIIIARAVVNADGTLANSNDITVAHPSGGTYELTIDVTGDTLPAGVTEDSFEVFVTIKENSGGLFVPYYVPVSLVGATLRVDVFIVNNVTVPLDRGFSVEVLLPAG